MSNDVDNNVRAIGKQSARSKTSMFGFSLQTLNSVGSWMMVVGAILAGFALVTSTISAYVLYRASNMAQEEASLQIRRLDLEVAQANERTEQLREKNLAMEKWIAPRELTPPQVEVLKRAVSSDKFKNKPVGIVAIYSDTESYRLNQPT